MDGSWNGRENRGQGLEPSGIRSRIARRRPFPDFNQMAQVPEKPAAAHAAAIAVNWWNVAVLCHLGQQCREVDACIAGQRQRMPEAPVYFHEHRWLARLRPEFHHCYSVPAESYEDRQTGATNLGVRLDAHAHRAARSCRIYIANASMGKLRAEFAMMHQSKVTSAFTLHILLDENGRRSLANVGIRGLKLGGRAGVTRPAAGAHISFLAQFLRGARLEHHGILESACRALGFIAVFDRDGPRHGNA